MNFFGYEPSKGRIGWISLRMVNGGSQDTLRSTFYVAKPSCATILKQLYNNYVLLNMFKIYVHNFKLISSNKILIL